MNPDHWLYRLTPEEWLRAAKNELVQAEGALASREQRRGVALARRAAGMAMNAALVLAPNEAWGRSYMDHLHAAAADESLSDSIREAARQLVGASLAGPRVVRLGGGGDEGLAGAARVVVDWCEKRVRAAG